MKRLLVLALLVSSAAHADSKAWTAAKKVIPANMEMVGGINAAAAHGSALYQTLLPMALAKAGGATAQFDEIKAACGIDVIDSIDSMVFAVDATEQNGTVVIAFKGVNRSKLEACAIKHAKSQQKTLTVSQAGALTKYSGVGDGGSDVYMRWLGSDVVALATKPDDKDASLAATSGGVASDRGLHGLKTVDKNASMWFVSNKQADMPGDLGGKMMGAYGSANVASGTVGIDVHIGVDSPQSATAAASKAEGEIAPMRGGQGGLADLLRTLKVAAAGSEVLVAAQVQEQALIGALSMFGLHN
ncbi:MAG TPA: hypothetical protein VGL61_07115 [Kofleriaceae bacterium]|jgi:hypothetical protein